jgi:hypothetical protein
MISIPYKYGANAIMYNGLMGSQIIRRNFLWRIPSTMMMKKYKKTRITRTTVIVSADISRSNVDEDRYDLDQPT